MIPSPDDDDAVWRALAHSTRRGILDLLFASPRSTGEIVTELDVDRHVVMAHLEILRAASLVTSEKRGRVRMNFLNAVPIQEINHRWISPTSGPWAAPLIAVRDDAENAKTQHTLRTLDVWKISS